jgi:hypothetical protein
MADRAPGDDEALAVIDAELSDTMATLSGRARSTPLRRSRGGHCTAGSLGDSII